MALSDYNATPRQIEAQNRRAAEHADTSCHDCGASLASEDVYSGAELDADENLVFVPLCGRCSHARDKRCGLI